MTRRSQPWFVPVVFLGPLALIAVLLRVVPAVVSIWLSLMKWDGFRAPAFVGLANYERMLADPTVRRAAVNTLAILLSLPLWVLLPLVIAALIHERPPGWRLFRTAMFLPAAFSPVIVGIVFTQLLQPHGPVNAVLSAITRSEQATGWLSNPATAMPVMLAAIIWASLGVAVMIFLAALSQVDPELVDAAHVEGARWRHVMRHVTIPSILPVIEFYTVIVVISMLTGLFAYVYSLTSGGPGFATYVPEYYVYLNAFKNADFGYASAIGTVLFGVVLVLVFILIRLFDRDSMKEAR